ncbi:NUDIX family hydrolase [Halteromyces radiatus]|uniref:NUDIX family hydrolase n=1 Tax=Halteromyces radiatus TaxID=101107 RepID=UPI00221F4D1D|nr:NUDIX family hydrolase [Halteromyces radiatus]KAI8093605.1 NUDIX family hydrolase [Halteromyces radiatus]
MRQRFLGHFISQFSFSIFQYRMHHHITIGKQTIPVISQVVSQDTLDKVMTFQPFQDWVRTFDKEQIDHHEEMDVTEIDIQNVDIFGSGKIGFVKFKVNVKLKATGQNAPGIVFMRGGAVSMMLLLQSEDDKTQDDKIILTLQPRIPVPSYNFPELPAGMLDASGDFAGAASKEIYEETGLTIHESELIDLTEKAYGDQWKGVYPSAGGSDEFLRLFLCYKKMKQQDIDALEGKLTGLRQEGENITLRLVSFKDAWKSSPDAKLLCSLTLYAELKKLNLI